MINEFDRIWNTALGLLGRRNHTAVELERKLLKRGFDKKIVHEIILKCIQLQLIDDKTSGRLYLNELVRKGYGPHRIRHEMVKKGLENHIVEELFLEDGLEKNEKALCNKVLNKKIKRISDKKDMKKTKALLLRFLIYRGFSKAVILDLIDEFFQK